MPNILVTGGAGFIGSNFIRHIQRVEPHTTIINLDALTYAANLDNLKDLPDPGRYRFIEGDICDRELVDRILMDHGITTIVHLAAETHVDRSIHGPDKFVRTNIIGTFTLLEAARRAWLEEKRIPLTQARFHHVSTDEVYGSLQPGEPAFMETGPYRPNSPYSATKASSDHLVRAQFQTYGLPVTITNCSNNYGPYQFPEKLIPLTLLNALRGETLPVYGDGLQVRDWLHVEDHCEAIWQVICRGRVGETYNVGGKNQPTNLQVIEEICSILDGLAPNSPNRPHSGLLRFVPDRPGHDRRYAIDIGKIERELDWHPKVGLTQGLTSTVRWYLENPEWIKAISNRTEFKHWLKENYRARGDRK
jgi:dTDP-glucose 4,6-dehydratase